MSRITILCDNSVGPLSGTLGEHGFAALLEHEGEAILFDTGGGDTLLHNAHRMNRDLRSVRRVVLSHGHYDHAGGLWPLLKSCGPKIIHAHPDIFQRRYSLRGGNVNSVGIPYAEPFLAGIGATFSYSHAHRELAPGVFLTGEVPRVTPFESGDAGLCCDEAGCAGDSVPDDQSLVLVTEKGLVLLLGCCHAGVVNTILHARKLTGVTEVYAIIGGCHLGFCGKEQLEGTIAALKRFRVKKICGSHCTGFAASARLVADFPGGFHPAHVGYTLEV
ncbi:MBL fold metallo-hydrolase [Geomesophilobacter sediminis]|uniref:MBL fold metallo-hydrolase n=1 Tax=Geomesophilobacter sediminis TaxID=2798584 RepID=A0A8J7JEX6_9BACT|nr:MBL fold metallo-hydrolase [Geomesophilobacter sediminis]MBJ6724734.1 MBL fold metallo-hydrolase [Geomesophilobacter sediminis]